MSVFRNLDCLSLFVYSNTTVLELELYCFYFFQNLRFQIGGCDLSTDAAYTRTFAVTISNLHNNKKQTNKATHIILSLLHFINFYKEIFLDKNDTLSAKYQLTSKVCPIQFSHTCKFAS